jgi:hypothetical protein
MKPDDARESELRQLFDRTADELSAAQLTKLAARALDVPQRRAGLARWLEPRVLAPALAAALATGAALFVFSGSHSEPDFRDHQAGPPSASPLQRPSDRMVVPLNDARAAARLVGLDVEPTWEPDDEFESLFGPPAEANLDAWLLATNELMQEGI